MKFSEPEVMELGEARELIQETILSGDDEGPVGARMWSPSAIYVEE